MTITLDHLNTCPPDQFVDALSGIYEHSPWIPEAALPARPFASLHALKHALHDVVRRSGPAAQLALIRAHPELAGKAAVAGALTPESTGEQAKAGLNQCNEQEYARLQQLNADYNQRFGFPFILAVKGPRGNGLTRQHIIETFARRLDQTDEEEKAECLRQIGRIAELRINDLLGHRPSIGLQVLDWAEALAQASDDPEGLTCAYLTPAHQHCAQQILGWMREAGMDAHIDALGNVVGRYAAATPDARTIITGSHYDTVRNGGKFDGRLGILLPIALVAQLHARGERLRHTIEIIAFSEEEGVRFKSTFLGSSAVAGCFDPDMLTRTDADGLSLAQVLTGAGHSISDIAAIARQPDNLAGFFEVHIEQGPVLLERDLPVGVVTAIAGSSRFQLSLQGQASHAGTTPMTMRRDAAAAAAEIVSYVERRCQDIPTLVGTVGQLQVPQGSVNVIPGKCLLSLDIRAAVDTTRQAAVDDILAFAQACCQRRNIGLRIEATVAANAVPCSPDIMQRTAQAIGVSGLPIHELPSGAGHDAMMMANLTSVGMLFVRCGNGGISHNPLETMTADDAELAGEILLHLLRHWD